MPNTITCPECRSHKVWRKGTVPTRQGKKERCVCTECGASFYSGKSTPMTKKPKRKSGKGRK